MHKNTLPAFARVAYVNAACKVEVIAKDLGIAPEMLVKKRQLVASLDGRQWAPSGWRQELLGDVFCV